MLKVATNIACYAALVVVLTSSITCAEDNKGYVVFEHTTLGNFSPTHNPQPEAIVETVSCTLARGEYEPIQIGVQAVAGGLKDIRVTVKSDLKVKVYHRIDPDMQQQLSTEPETVVLMEVPGEIYLQRGDVVHELEAGHSVNFWLLIHAGPKTSPGMHQGKIVIQPAGQAATELDLKVQVRPFSLAAPRAVFGAYYREDFLPTRFGVWDLEDDLALEIYRDMAAHGQNSVTFYHAGDFRSQIPPVNSHMVDKSLPLAQEAGLARPDIPCVAVQLSICGEDISQTQMEAAVAWLASERHQHGWPELIVFGRDEGLYPGVGLRETYAPLRLLPIRLSTDMSHISPAYAYADIHDVWTLHDGLVTPEILAEAKRMGAEVWVYSYQIWRKHYSPVSQRYFAGLHTWAHKFSGNWIWAYAHNRHSQVWWKPNSNEPMPHMGWEARREGVDDYRYLQMVEDLVKAKKPDPLAVEAGTWLEGLRARLTLTDVQPHDVEAGKPLDIEEYDAIRARAADYIERLGPIVNHQAPMARQLKDEAAAFRGKSVQQCIDGLKDADVAKRRAAAWALFELGPQAALATPALTKLLDDPEVRIPALHALDAIGPEAYPAASKIASLLSDRDPFVRQAATFALVGITRPQNWDDKVGGYASEDVSPHAHTVVPALQQALGDSHEDVRWIAAYGLARCAEAAAPILPDVMEMAKKPAGDERGIGLRLLSGMGPAAADAVPFLVKSYAESKGEDRPVTYALAAIGPAASGAIAVLEKYRTPKNPYLANTCYALFSIRGDESDLKTMVDLLGEASCPRGSEEWEDVITLLNALGGEAAPVAPLVQDRLSLLDSKPNLKRQLELVLSQRIKAGGSPFRLLAQ